MHRANLLPGPALITDGVGLVLEINTELLGWVGGGAADWRGQPMQRLLSPASRIYLQTHVWPRLYLQGSVREVALQVIDAKRQPLPVSLSSQRIDEGGPATYCWLFFSALKHHQLKAELRVALRRADLSEQALALRDRLIEPVCAEETGGLSRGVALVGLDRGECRTHSSRAGAGTPAGLPARWGRLDSCGQRVDPDPSLAAAVFDSMSQGLMVTDGDGVILSVNRAFTAITGFSALEATGQRPRPLKSGRLDPAFYADLSLALHAHGRWQGETWNRRKTGALYLIGLNVGVVAGVSDESQRLVWVFSEITALQQASQAPVDAATVKA